MTITPTRARALVDASTGDLVVITQHRITWAPRRAAPVDITPGFDWTSVAVGGGAVAVAGADAVTWTGPNGSTHDTAAPGAGVFRLAVAGRRVVGVTGEGQLLAWESLDAEPVTADLADEPDEVAMDGDRSLLTVSGWRDERATLAVFEWRQAALRPVRPVRGWPAPAAGVALGLPGGTLGIGGNDALTLVSPGGDVLGVVDLPGLERVAGSADGVGWARSSATDDGGLVGWGTVTGSGRTRGVDLVAEQPMPGADPFAELALFGGALVVAEGVDAHALLLHRLTRQGWLDPEAVRVEAGPAE